MKRALRILVILIILLLLAAVSARWYLSSRQVADKVAGRLEALYGGAVHVAEVDIGLNSSAIGGLTLLEKGSESPWLTIDNLDADLSLFELLRGETSAGKITLTGAKVLLRFDKEGKLLTSFPDQFFQGPDTGNATGQVPTVVLENGQVTVRKEGSPDLVLENVHGIFQKDKDHLLLTGGTGNVQWGLWSLAGRSNPDGKNLDLKINSAGAVHITQGMLEQIPFIPPSVWREVRIEQGDSDAQVNVTYDLDKKEWHYVVQLQPKNTDVQVKSINLHATNVGGQLTVKDQRIELRNVEGNAFAGKLRTSANFDFTEAATRLEFPRIEAEGLDVGRFPPSWDFPPQITGKLKGSASLKVITTTDKSHTEGSGQGQIVDAFVAGQPAAEPIELELRAAPGGFRFGTKSQAARAQPAPQPKSKPPEVAKGKTPDAGQKGPAYFEINLKMNDVDLGKFEHDMNVKLPFTLAGKVSFAVKVGIPVNDSRDLKKYKVHGSAQLSQFVLGDLKIAAAETELSLAAGVLRMSTLKGTLADDAGRPPGSFAGTASFPIEPLGDLRLQLELNNIPLSLLASLAGGADMVQANLSGRMTAVVPGKSLTDSNTWQATAHVGSKEIAAYGLAVTDFSAQLGLAKGTLAVTDFKGKLARAPFTAAAQLQLAAPFPFSGNISLQKLDLADLQHLEPQARLPIAVHGDMDAAASFKGTGYPLQIQAELNVKAPKLRLQNIPTEEIKGNLSYQKGLVNYRLEGKSLGGSFELEGQLPPADNEDKKTEKGRLRINDVQIHRLFQALNLGNATEAFHGRLNVEFDYQHNSQNGWPTGSGRVRLSNLRYQNNFLADEIGSELILSGEELRLRDISSEFGQGTIQARMVVNLKKLGQSWFTVNLDRVEASYLLGPWLGDKVKGPLQARIRGKLGPEWHGTADVAMAQGQVMGLTITNWRLPVSFGYAPAEGRGEINISESNAQAGSGSIKCNAALSWQDTVSLEGKLAFMRVDLQSLLRQTGGSSHLIGGLLTGRFDFTGHQMRSVDDLTGNFQASFEQAQALSLPVLKQISPFLGIGPSTTFQSGTLRARLEHGSVHVQALSLEAVNYQVFIEGKVSLQEQLDLDVLANTGNLGIGTPRLRLLGLKVPIAGPVPLVVAQETASLLANRVVRARVTGTLKSPHVRILPLATLSQEAARFFLTVGLARPGTSSPLSAFP